MADESDRIVLCLAGDVMLGRGIDQILEHPSDPTLYEPWVRSAAAYVSLAEQASGDIPRSVDPGYVWGVMSEVATRTRPDITVVNLETAVTDHDRPWPGKGIQYRMHPANVGVLVAGGIDLVSLANNHVMDWSIPGMVQTVEVLRDAGITTSGAGRDRIEAWEPARLSTAVGDLVVVGAATRDSGVPGTWAATDDRPGVAFLPDLSERSGELLAAAVEAWRRPGDVVVASIHWGPNWGYRIGRDRRRFAHRLIDEAGVDLIHGHSSHHPLGLEVYHERLVLYGCGDLITDYEGITGHEAYRGELGAIYLPVMEAEAGRLVELSLVPTKMSRFRLTSPPKADIAWLAEVLDRESRPLGARARLGDDGTIRVSW